jgi:lipopolysaccharide export system permease protein
VRILTRYILKQFLKNYFISLGVLVGLYVVLDMVVNFDELSGQKDAVGTPWETLLQIFDYYYYQLFLIFNQLSGTIPVVAASFTVVRLQRNNELTAVMAAGVPLVRAAAPIILMASTIIIVLGPIDQELVIPNIIHKLLRERNRLSGDQARSFQVRMRDSDGRIVMASKFTPAGTSRPARFEHLDIIETDEGFRPDSIISAEAATWNEPGRRWDLEGGRRTEGLAPDDRRSEPEPVATYQSNITPREVMLMRSGELVDLLSTAEINQLLASPAVYGTGDFLRVKHARIAQWIINIIVVLLSIGAMLTREPGQLQKRSMICFGVTGACLAMVFVCQHLAALPPPNLSWADHWPAVMSWLPIFLFGPLSVWMLDRVKS